MIRGRLRATWEGCGDDEAAAMRAALLLTATGPLACLCLVGLVLLTWVSRSGPDPALLLATLGSGYLALVSWARLQRPRRLSAPELLCALILGGRLALPAGVLGLLWLGMTCDVMPRVARALDALAGLLPVPPVIGALGTLWLGCAALVLVLRQRSLAERS
ncbi:MAG: hypothetical protein AB7N76_28435 [Planctomycetota bacterium]